MEGEGDRNDGQDIALGPMKKAHVKNWVFSDCGSDRIKVWRVLGGGSWRSQLVSRPNAPTDSSERTSLANLGMLQLLLDVCATTGGRIGLPGHVWHLMTFHVQPTKFKSKSAGTAADSGESSSVQWRL